MQVSRRLVAPMVLVLACPLLSLLETGPALAFQVGQSPDFGACNIWFNDQGQPLRNKIGREIAQAVPCPGQGVRRDAYKVFAGTARNTLIIQDETNQLECVLGLVRGSTTVMEPTSCKPYRP